MACLLELTAVVLASAGGDDFVCHNGTPSTQRNFAPCGIQGRFFFFVFFWIIIILIEFQAHYCSFLELLERVGGSL
jgi:hypothetical protein